MTVLDAIARRRGVRLVVVDVGEAQETVEAWFAAHPLPPGAQLVLDPQAEASRRWGQHRFPTTFVLGGGTIRHINRGFGPGYAARLDRWVTGLQAPSPTPTAAPSPTPTAAPSPPPAATPSPPPAAAPSPPPAAAPSPPRERSETRAIGDMELASAMVISVSLLMISISL
jgi:hypothetical protein